MRRARPLAPLVIHESEKALWASFFNSATIAEPNNYQFEINTYGEPTQRRLERSVENRVGWASYQADTMLREYRRKTRKPRKKRA